MSSPVLFMSRAPDAAMLVLVSLFLLCPSAFGRRLWDILEWEKNRLRGWIICLGSNHHWLQIGRFLHPEHKALDPQPQPQLNYAGCRLLRLA